MKTYCTYCGKYMGDIEGKLRKGWGILCSDCHDPAQDYTRNTQHDEEAVEALKGLFGMKK